MAESKIKLFCECMESDVKPLMYDEIFEGLMDLLHLAIIEAYERGKRANNDSQRVDK